MDYKQWLGIGVGGLVVGTTGIVVASTVAMSSVAASGLVLSGMLIDLGALYACGNAALKMVGKVGCCDVFVTTSTRGDLEAGQLNQAEGRGRGPAADYGSINPPRSGSWVATVSGPEDDLAPGVVR